MEKQDDLVVLPNSPEAATYRTDIKGWVSRTGRYFGEDERIARFDGSTHNICEDCGKQCQKHWLACPECLEKRNEQKHAKRKREEWDGTTPLYSDVYDEYFFDEDSLIDHMDHVGNSLDEMRLVICVPRYAHQIDAEEWHDELPSEDHGDPSLPGDIQEALDNLNKVISEHKEPLSWIPGDVAAIVKIEEDESR